MIPLEKVNSIILRYDELEKLLSKTNIDKKEFVKNSKAVSYTHLTLPTKA